MRDVTLLVWLTGAAACSGSEPPRAVEAPTVVAADVADSAKSAGDDETTSGDETMPGDNDEPNGTAIPNHAAPDGMPIPHNRPGPRKPQLRHALRCGFPEQARKEGREAIVPVQLTIGVDGRVSDLRVVTDPGEDFANAAIACLQGAIFKPAFDDAGNPIVTTIEYRVRFVTR